MKKQKLVTLSLIILICLIGFRVSFFAQAQVRQSTINYLANGPQDAWVTQGLAATGRDNLDLSYLADFNGQSANEFARTILAVAATRQNPMAFNGQDLVNGLLSYRNNQQIGSISLINDDFWGIIALRAAGYSADSPIISESKNFILTAQNNDGSFSYAPQSAGDSNDTAAAIIALLEAGQASNSQQIERAIAYLRNLQNEDGGFAFTNGQSDSGSDAWVIAALNKLGIDPQSWQRSGHSPISHLESLMLEDGSFRWLSGDAQGNRLMTAYAAVALAGRSFPVAYFQAPQDGQPENQNLHHLRIEGQSNTICDAEVEATTVLNIIENGAAVCGYTFHVASTGFGPYLDQINNEAAVGESGWLYWVNWLSGNVGAADYQLQPGDAVLWAYGQFSVSPLRLRLSASQAEVNATINATVEYLNNQSWSPVSSSTVIVGDRTFLTGQNGQASFSVADRATLRVYAQKENFIRSQKELLAVGSGESNNVHLTVNIESGGGDGTLAFQVDASDLNFGSLRPGGQLTRNVRVTNTGGVPIYLESVVSGDNVFLGNLYLNGLFWENYNQTIARGNAASVAVNLRIPANYASSGQKQGDLIFWAAAR